MHVELLSTIHRNAVEIANCSNPFERATVITAIVVAVFAACTMALAGAAAVASLSCAAILIAIYNRVPHIRPEEVELIVDPDSGENHVPHIRPEEVEPIVDPDSAEMEAVERSLAAWVSDGDVEGAKELIRKCARSRSSVLSLKGKGLTSLPNLSPLAPHLRRFDCSHNLLERLETKLSSCTELQYLDCSHNRLRLLNAKSLSRLQTLIGSHNDLTWVYIKGLSQLQHVNFSYNQLNIVFVSEKSHLTYFAIHNNPLQAVSLIERVIYSKGAFQGQISSLEGILQSYATRLQCAAVVAGFQETMR